MLTKRLSTHSISSAAAAQLASSQVDHRAQNGKPSSIPRPSMPMEKQSSTSSTNSNAVSMKKRQRTNSTPYSPQASVPLPTRIPKVSTKGSGGPYHPYKASTTPSVSSSVSGSVASRTTRGKGMEPPSPSETGMSTSSSLRNPRLVRNSYIPNEEAPFPNSASTSTEFQYEQTRLMHTPSLNAGLHSRYWTTGASSDRPSLDEVNEPSDGEKPFEHWYRGEAARNGGVGELKVARSEMLEIAQFGHRSSPLGMYSTTGGLRRRAGSMDEKRESWIMDENAFKMSKVIDESPLTDIEGDDYTTEGERAYPAYSSTSQPRGIGYNQGGSAADLQGDTLVHEEDALMSTTPTALSSMPSSKTNQDISISSTGHGQNSTRSQMSPSGSSKIPLGASNGANTTPGKAPSVKSTAAGKAKPKPKSQSTTRQRSQTSPSQSTEGHEEANQSVENAEKIPYRLPPSKGNWDDIVLPAISKKMGIEGYGLKSDGGIMEISEEARRRMSAIPPPVPGLFGYDNSKYKPPRPEEDIQMGDLVVAPESRPATPKTASPPPPEQVPARTSNGRESPLAFSHYQTNLPPLSEKPPKRKSQVPDIKISHPSAEELAKHKVEEDKHSGCCGCVVQ